MAHSRCREGPHVGGERQDEHAANVGIALPQNGRPLKCCRRRRDSGTATQPSSVTTRLAIAYSNKKTKSK